MTHMNIASSKLNSELLKTSSQYSLIVWPLDISNYFCLSTVHDLVLFFKRQQVDTESRKYKEYCLIIGLDCKLYRMPKTKLHPIQLAAQSYAYLLRCSGKWVGVVFLVINTEQ